jgi:hypothetical protein
VGLILLTFLTRLKAIESRFGFRYGEILGSWREGFGPANDGKFTRMEEEQSSESSGILKKFRGRFAMARLKAIESRFGFRYGGGQSHIFT